MLSFLNENKASIFAKAIQFFKIEVKVDDYIFAFTDFLASLFAKRNELDPKVFFESSIFKNIILNHITRSILISDRKMKFKTLKGNTYIFYSTDNSVTIDDMNGSLIHLTKTTNNHIYMIKGILLTENDIGSINNLLPKSELLKLPTDVLRHMIQAGELHGYDVISLCSTSKDLQNVCNNKNGLLYKTLLMKDYDIDGNNLSGEQAKELFIKRTNAKLYIAGTSTDFGFDKAYKIIFAPKQLQDTPVIKMFALTDKLTFIDFDNNIFETKRIGIEKLGNKFSKISKIYSTGHTNFLIGENGKVWMTNTYYRSKINIDENGQVKGLNDIIDIAGRAYGDLFGALTKSGDVYIFGNNDALNPSFIVPIGVINNPIKLDITNVKKMSIGQNKCFFLKNNGELWTYAVECCLGI